VFVINIFSLKILSILYFIHDWVRSVLTQCTSFSIFGILLFVLFEVCLKMLDFVMLQNKYRLLLELKCC
jgi:hypothetical protein